MRWLEFINFTENYTKYFYADSLMNSGDFLRILLRDINKTDFSKKKNHRKIP